MKTMVCQQCGINISRKKPSAKFCSQKHQVLFWRETKKTEQQEYARSYYKKNSERIKSRSKERHARCKKDDAQYARRYYKNNKEAISLKAKIYYSENKDKVLEYHKHYQTNNSLAIFFYNWLRRLSDPVIHNKCITRSKAWYEANKDHVRERSRANLNHTREMSKERRVKLKQHPSLYREFLDRQNQRAKDGVKNLSDWYVKARLRENGLHSISPLYITFKRKTIKLKRVIYEKSKHIKTNKENIARL